MRIAIMQPYFFPYMGYLQLIKAADRFIFLDDVSFIKKGWIHRNRLCFNGKAHWFSIPLESASQFKPINETFISCPEFMRWKRKFLASLFFFYKKQPYFAESMELVEAALASSFRSVSELAVSSLRMICDALDISTPLECSSSIQGLTGLKGEKRLIEICRRYQGDSYINAPGGKNLYSRAMFAPHGIRLEFLRPSLRPYPAKGRDFIPGLSVLDALMCCGRSHVRENLLSGYDIEEAA